MMPKENCRGMGFGRLTAEPAPSTHLNVSWILCNQSLLYSHSVSAVQLEEQIGPNASSLRRPAFLNCCPHDSESQSSPISPDGKNTTEASTSN